MGYKGEEVYQNGANIGILYFMAPKKCYPLPRRPLDVLQALADGEKTYADVALRIHSTEQAVKQMMSGSSRRRGAFGIIEQMTGHRPTKAGAVAFAIESGWVTFEKEY